MAEDTQRTSTPEHNQQAWEAEHYEAALAHLERLQEQLDGLRAVIPSIVAPLMQTGRSKAQMFADVRESAIRSSGDVKQFRESWTSEQTLNLFAKSRGSIGVNGDLRKAQSVANYGWSERPS